MSEYTPDVYAQPAVVVETPVGPPPYHTPAVYQNKKNGELYTCLGIADEKTEDLDAPRVVYQDKDGKLHYRHPADFEEKFNYYGPIGTPRREVMAFAIEMENVLRDNEAGRPGKRAKTGWHMDSVESLFEHYEDEVREYRIEVNRYLGHDSSTPPEVRQVVLERLTREGIDVANMVLMVNQQAKAGY